MGLFSKPKVPGINTGALQDIVNRNKQTQVDILGRKKQALAPLSEQFKTGRAALSAQIEPGANKQLAQFGQELQGVGAQERTANDAAAIQNRQQAFRNVPDIQRSIRESLGGSGLLRSGVASREIARPILDASRSASDFSSGLQVDQLRNEARRSEGLATTGFNTRNAAMNARLGMDEETFNELSRLGRTDILEEYAALANAEGAAGDATLEIEQLRQASEQDKARAKAARRGQILSSLGSVAGAGLGALSGNPLLVGLGAQAGGAVGNLAGGGTGGQFDPTLLAALIQQRQQNRAVR